MSQAFMPLVSCFVAILGTDALACEEVRHLFPLEARVLADSSIQTPKEGAAMLAFTGTGQPVVFRKWSGQQAITAQDAAGKVTRTLTLNSVHVVGPIVGLISIP